MKIISIKFSKTGGKSYDYLLVNPKGVVIDNNRPLRMPNGASPRGVYYKEVFVEKISEKEVLPGWVTTQIVLEADNICQTERLAAAKIEELKTPKPKTVKTSETAATKAVENPKPKKTGLDRIPKNSSFSQRTTKRIRKIILEEMHKKYNLV